MKKLLALCLAAALCSATASATPTAHAPAPASVANLAGPAQAMPRDDGLPTCGYICDSFGRCYRVCY